MGPKHEKKVAIELICPKCKYTQIIYLPKEQPPQCPRCNTLMVFRELLTEGKSY